MKKIIYFIILLVLLVSCESKREIIINRKKSGIIADGQQINMLYTEPSEYIKLINDNPLFAVCMFDSKTDYADDYIAVFNNLTPLLEEEYGFVPEVAVDFGGNTIFTQEKHTYYDWGDGISVNQTYYLDNYFYHIYDEYILSAYESVFTIRSFEETVEIPMHVSPRIDLIAPDPTGLPYDPVMGLYYDRAVIKWNGDSLNTNGVLVMVRWIGNNVDSDQVQDGAFVLNADIVPDNGECVLDNRLFQGIPDGAIITLSILRANIHDVNDFEFAEGLFTDVTFATVSQSLRAHIVLIREMP